MIMRFYKILMYFQYQILNYVQNYVYLLINVLIFKKNKRLNYF